MTASSFVDAFDSRRRPRRFPKGRRVDPDAMDEVRALLGDVPLRRDLLIEHLHRLQDDAGYLSARRLAALARLMRLPMAEVWETATFYHHFDPRREAEAPPAPITVRVCASLPCAMAGSESLLESLLESFDSSRVRVVSAPCMGRCAQAPAAAIGRDYQGGVSASSILEAVEARRVEPTPPDGEGFEAYRSREGYVTLLDLREGRLGSSSVLSSLAASGLRGLGGAGFPTSRKWELVRSESSPRYLCVNADEGEPGTFKDRFHLESSPHQFLEGMLIAAEMIETKAVYIYLRDEYSGLRLSLSREIGVLRESGMIGDVDVILRRGAGSYVCGEESAMIESLEGKRGLPRHRPPYVASEGLFGRPTLAHNVETLYWIPEILRGSRRWFDAEGGKGLRSYSVSGRVRSPGVKIAPAGISARTLIDEHCGGMAEGCEFRAYLPGGASGGILPASLADEPLDFGTLEAHGCFVGSHAVIVLSQLDDVRSAALNLTRFFEDESCGQCSPCRVGCEKAAALMSEPLWNRRLLEELSEVMRDASICGLGQAAPNPMLCAMRYFSEGDDS